MLEHEHDFDIIDEIKEDEKTLTNNKSNEQFSVRKTEDEEEETATIIIERAAKKKKR